MPRTGNDALEVRLTVVKGGSSVVEALRQLEKEGRPDEVQRRVLAAAAGADAVAAGRGGECGGGGAGADRVRPGEADRTARGHPQPAPVPCHLLIAGARRDRSPDRAPSRWPARAPVVPAEHRGRSSGQGRSWERRGTADLR